VYVPETYLAPQVVGGLIFGVGFALGGLCPGTSCVAAVTGRLDGVALVLGMWSGVLATGLFFPLLAKFYDSTPRGSLTLPQLTGLPYGVVVLAIVLVALAGFRGAQWLESRPRTQAASRSTPNDVREPRRALEGVGR
jgi:uncharacterized membrane protein YedE/YeeE